MQFLDRNDISKAKSNVMFVPIFFNHILFLNKKLFTPI